MRNIDKFEDFLNEANELDAKYILDNKAAKNIVNTMVQKLQSKIRKTGDINELQIKSAITQMIPYYIRKFGEKIKEVK